MSLGDPNADQNIPFGPISDFDPDEFIEFPGFDGGYEDILELETKQVDDYVVRDGETAIYLSQSSLWRLVNVSVTPDRQPLLILSVRDGRVTATAGDAAVRSDVEETPLEIKSSTPKHEQLRFIVDQNDLMATLQGAESTIRIVHAQGERTLSVVSGEFERPIQLHDTKLPKLLERDLQVDVVQTHRVPADTLSRTLKHLKLFAASNNLGTDRSIEFQDGVVAAGGRPAASQIRSTDFKGLNFSIDHAYIHAIINTIGDARDGVVRIDETSNYVSFDTGTARLAIPQADKGVDPALFRFLNLDFSKDFDRAAVPRQQLCQSLSRAIDDECLTVRLKHTSSNAFMFISATEDGVSTQFKLVGRQQKSSHDRPEADFRIALAPLLHAANMVDAPHIFIDSSKTVVVIDDGWDHHQVRTLLPKLPISQKRGAEFRFQAPSFDLRPEEIVDDNL